MCNRIKSLFVFAGAMATLISCSVDEFVNNGGHTSKQDMFSFKTTNKVGIDIDYGPLASQTLVKIYGENPLVDATEEDETPQGEPIGSAFLDTNGRFNGTLEIPGHIQTLYFYASSMAAPQLTIAELEGDAVKVTNQPISSSRQDTRSVSDDQLVVRKLNSSENGGTATNFYTINGGWDNYGNLEDVNHLIDYGALTSDDVHSIEHYFWYISDGVNNWTKPGDPTGARLERLKNMRVNNVNMVVQEQYEENGQIYDVESAEVWFTFITEYAWNENVVGYYFFDKNNPPKSAAEIDKKFVILPNASTPAHYPFEKLDTRKLRYPEDKVPTTINRRYQLLYMDEDGNVSKNFPPNTEIGFFIIPNGFEMPNNFQGPDETINGFTYTTRKNGLINTNATAYYSNYEFNTGDDNTAANKNPRKRYVACRLANGTVVYGCEDASNSSYDDMMFTITASPNKAIHTEGGSVLTEIPQKKVDRKYVDKSENYTYAFENIWPDGGDYDLNDVIVYHNRTVTKDQFNDVSRVVDKFRFEVNQWTTSSCSFAIHMRAGHLGDRREMPEGAWFEEETGSFFFADDVRNSNVNGHTLTLVREFDHPVSFSEIQDELNPFLVNQSMGPDCHSQGRVEIHLPLGEITSMGKAIGNEHNPAYGWFINDNGYPYALKIPGTTFDPCEERVRIGSGPGAYPKFNHWAETLGKENKDWYLYK